MPATVLLEVRQALAGTIDLEREIGAGDRFYVRYRQTFTADGVPIGTARAAVGRAAHEGQGHDRPASFPPNGGTERLWLANGEAAGAAPLRLPLDVINVSSGFGLRPDPLDKPGPAMGPLADPAPVAAAPPPEPPPPPKEEPLPPVRRPTLGGLSAFGGARDVFDPPSGRPTSIAAAPTLKPAPEVAKAPEPPKVETPPPPPPKPRPCSCMTGSTSSP